MAQQQVKISGRLCQTEFNFDRAVLLVQSKTAE